MFRFSKLQIDLALESEAAPRGYWGSRLRGGYGRVLKEGLCDHQHIPDCRECPRFRACDFPRLFQPLRTSDESRLADAPLKHKVDLPRPFVLDPPPVTERDYRRGEIISLGFTSLGPLCESIAYPVLAFERFEQTGIPGRSEYVSRFRLAGVRDLLAGGRSIGVTGKDSIGETGGSSIYEKEMLSGAITRDIASYARDAWVWEGKAELEAKFITPLTVVNSHARQRDPESGITMFTDFYDLIYNLTNRVGGLWQLYGEDWPGQTEFFRWREQLLKASRQVTTTHRELEMVRTWGFSNHQHADRPMGGFTGSMRFAGDFAPFAEVLGIGEIVHVGNQTAFGLGRYRVGG